MKKINGSSDFIDKVIHHIYKKYDYTAHVVWFCYTLGNCKGLFMVEENDMYYEVTYDINRDIVYVDTYGKYTSDIYDNDSIMVEVK